MKCSVAQCNAVQYSAVQLSEVYCCTTQCSEVHCCTAQCNEVQCNEVYKPMMTYHLLPQSDVLFFVFWWNFRVNNGLVDCSAFYYTVNHCMALYRIVLHWNSVTEQHCMPLQCIVLHCTALYGIVCNCFFLLNSTVWHCRVLHCTAQLAPNGIIENYVALNITVWHCRVVHCTA